MASLSARQSFATAYRLHQAGQLAQAEALYRQVLAIEPTHADALHMLGVLAHQVGKGDLAIELISRALALNPKDAAAHANLGEMYRMSGRLPEAIASFDRALALRPELPEVLTNRGSALAEQNRFEQAIVGHRKALELRPNYVAALNNLGMALTEADELKEAVAVLRKAQEIAPTHADVLSNLGAALTRRGMIEAASSWMDVAQGGAAELVNPSFREAEASFKRAIAAQPDFAEAHLNLSLLLMHLQRHEEGWQEYEWRWKTRGPTSPIREFSVPAWDGQPMPGKTILVYAEQGFGDALHFLRYLPRVHALSQAAKVIFECRKSLALLLDQCLPEFIEVTSDATSHHFDAQVALLSVPLVSKVFEPVVAENPYLQANGKLRAQWNKRLRSKKKRRELCVGLAWSGNPDFPQNARRSVSPEKLAGLVRLPGTRFINLQIDPRMSLPPELSAAGVLDFRDDIHSFADSAALIAELDLVITVDTAIAHLAGALGRPVWTLLSLIPDWRWGLHGEQTSLYPTMRLFRQRTLGDWEEVLQRVAGALSDSVA